jgi:hypothetical protein
MQEEQEELSSLCRKALSALRGDSGDAKVYGKALCDVMEGIAVVLDWDEYDADGIRDMLTFLLSNAARSVLNSAPVTNGTISNHHLKSPSLNVLGNDLLRHILTFLKAKDLAKVSSVSKHFEKTSVGILWKSAAIYVNYQNLDEEEDVAGGEHIIGLYPACDWTIENDIDEFLRDEDLDVSDSWKPSLMSFHEDNLAEDEQEENVLDLHRARLSHCESLFLRGNLSFIQETLQPSATLNRNLKFLVFRFDEDDVDHAEAALELLEQITGHCTQISSFFFQVSISWISNPELRTKFFDILKKMKSLQEFNFWLSPWVALDEFTSFHQFSEMARDALVDAPLKYFNFSSEEAGFYFREFDRLVLQHKDTIEDLEVSRCDLSLLEVQRVTEECKLERLSMWDFVDSSSPNQNDTVQQILKNVAPTVKALEFGPHQCESFPDTFPLLEQMNFVFYNRDWRDVIQQLHSLLPQLTQFHVCEADDLFAPELPQERARPSFREVVLNLPDSEKLQEILFSVESADYISPSASETDFHQDVVFLRQVLKKFPNIELLTIPDASFSEKSRFALVRSFIRSRDRSRDAGNGLISGTKRNSRLVIEEGSSKLDEEAKRQKTN